MFKNKKYSLSFKTWVFLVLFSIFILAFVWLFQIVFLKTYYESRKVSEVYNVSKNIMYEYNIKQDFHFLEDIALKHEMCIEVNLGEKTVYSTDIYNKGCIVAADLVGYKEKFINSNEEIQAYKIVNEKLDTNSIIYGINLKNNVYAFVSTSLVPLESTINILAEQFIYVTIFVLIISFIVAYFLSNKLSKPIIKLNYLAEYAYKAKEKVDFNLKSGIVEIDELGKTLEKNNKELIKTDELRRELMANVSHDLKTPLTMISAYAEMARDLNQNNQAKREENLNVIIEESKRLNLLVNDILDLSRVESKLDILDLTTFNINDLITKIINHYHYKEDFTFIFKNKKTYYVQADYKRIEQVLYNLINNAINYSKDDKTITINLKKVKNKLLVEVIDKGIGIKDEDIDLIWDKYYKSDKKYQRNTTGSGIGLSIVKNILINHHSEYGVETKLNQGSTFYFYLPLK